MLETAQLEAMLSSGLMNGLFDARLVGCFVGCGPQEGKCRQPWLYYLTPTGYVVDHRPVTLVCSYLNQIADQSRIEATGNSRWRIQASGFDSSAARKAGVRIRGGSQMLSALAS